MPRPNAARSVLCAIILCGIILCGTLPAALVGALPAAAQDWPTRPLRAIVPVSAGSSTDLVARAVFEGLAPALGQPIVIRSEEHTSELQSPC